MCGRTTLITKKEIIEKRFGVEIDFDWVPRYNIAPSQFVPIITNESPDKITLAYWGLLPPWATDDKPAHAMINARADGISKKPFFRHAFKKNRCLIIADGFYEWEKKGKAKLPYRICLHSGEPFAFAGLWEPVKDDKGRMVPSFAIVTTEANEVVGKIHNRMPVILPPEKEKEWMDISRSPEEAESLLKPYPNDETNIYPVSPNVNKAIYNQPDAVTPVSK
jgi:putative SOS response-associated peptidase YedK